MSILLIIYLLSHLVYIIYPGHPVYPVYPIYPVNSIYPVYPVNPIYPVYSVCTCLTYVSCQSCLSCDVNEILSLNSKKLLLLNGTLFSPMAISTLLCKQTASTLINMYLLLSNIYTQHIAHTHLLYLPLPPPLMGILVTKDNISKGVINCRPPGPITGFLFGIRI